MNDAIKKGTQNSLCIHWAVFAKGPFVSEEMPVTRQPGRSLVLIHASDIRSLKLCTKSILGIALHFL